ncbi:MAG: glutamate racemase [Lachnospiraceae bacterium]|nr:glutamate racemase [Lachnospiraceae bacterium]
MKIGIFDSGIGGLSVLHRALQVMPDDEFIYYADTDNVPYGEKPREVILNIVGNVMEFLVERNVDAVVVACNTATSVAIKAMRENYDLPIIGMEPAVKKAREEYPEGRTLVMATPVTVRGDKMKYLLERVDSEHLVDMIPMPKLVRFAESGIFDGNEVQDYIREQLKGTDLDAYTSLVLGCTHFNYFKKALRCQIPERIAFVDGIEGTVAQLLRKVGRTPADASESTPNVEYYYSGRPATPKEVEQINTCYVKLDEVSRDH